MGPTNEQIAAVLRELMRAVAERGALVPEDFVCAG
jgi:hypothetical protein